MLKMIERIGEIEHYLGQKIVANGPPQATIGEHCEILNHQKEVVAMASIVGFEGHKVYLMPYSNLPIRMGYKVRALPHDTTIEAGEALLGRVINAFGAPMDGLGPIVLNEEITLEPAPINPLSRTRIKERMTTGIKALDLMMPIGIGQRIGVFAGSGVGKSVLLSMIAKSKQSDVNVIALIGERGREVVDWLEHILDANTRAKSVIVVACSDETPIMRERAAIRAVALSQYFCQKQRRVLLMMDSITRLAMAKREMGLALGEPPTARGYTPSVYGLLPRLIEQAGAFKHGGSITGIYTVLVEGDDFNEPLSDQLRSLLDGHIVLNRDMAMRGLFPAIDLRQSLSRLNHTLMREEERTRTNHILNFVRMYHQHRDLIELGAYEKGQQPALDVAIEKIPQIESFFKQSPHETISFEAIERAFLELCA